MTEPNPDLDTICFIWTQMYCVIDNTLRKEVNYLNKYIYGFTYACHPVPSCQLTLGNAAFPTFIVFYFKYKVFSI